MKIFQGHKKFAHSSFLRCWLEASHLLAFWEHLKSWDYLKQRKMVSAINQGLLQYGPITELIFWKSYLETKSSKVLVISFEHLQKLCIFAKFGRHSSKIEPATPISISKCFGRKFKFERTKSLQILSKVVSYCDLQLVKIWCWYLKPLLINSKITNFASTF